MSSMGGLLFKFNESTSLYVDCEIQEEVDTLWDKLPEKGSKSRRGWLKDRFGLWWPINLIALGKLIKE